MAGHAHARRQREACEGQLLAQLHERQAVRLRLGHEPHALLLPRLRTGASERNQVEDLVGDDGAPVAARGSEKEP